MKKGNSLAVAMASLAGSLSASTQGGRRGSLMKPVSAEPFTEYSPEAQQEKQSSADRKRQARSAKLMDDVLSGGFRYFDLDETLKDHKTRRETFFL